MIVSDEGPSIETCKDTDFVVAMTASRRARSRCKREPVDRWGDDDFFRSFFGGSSSKRTNYKGFPFFR